MLLEKSLRNDQAETSSETWCVEQDPNNVKGLTLVCKGSRVLTAASDNGFAGEILTALHVTWQDREPRHSEAAEMEQLPSSTQRCQGQRGL